MRYVTTSIHQFRTVFDHRPRSRPSFSAAMNCAKRGMTSCGPDRNRPAKPMSLCRYNAMAIRAHLFGSAPRMKTSLHVRAHGDTDRHLRNAWEQLCMPVLKPACEPAWCFKISVMYHVKFGILVKSSDVPGRAWAGLGQAQACQMSSPTLSRGPGRAWAWSGSSPGFIYNKFVKDLWGCHLRLSTIGDPTRFVADQAK